jgi:Zn-dependent metalloprotease
MSRASILPRRRHLRALLAVLLFVLAAPLAAQQKIVAADAAGLPTFVEGKLGSLAAPADLTPRSRAAGAGDQFELEAKSFLESFAAAHLRSTGNESHVPRKIKVDQLGTWHVLFDQELHGLKVYGAQLWVHADRKGEVYAVNGNFAPAGRAARPDQTKVSAADLQRPQDFGLAGEPLAEPELAYFHLAEEARTALVWRLRLGGIEDGQLFDDFVYLDATTGEVVARDPQIHSAKVRRTYDGKYGGFPGDLLCTDAEPCGDVSAQRAHDGAGKVYDYYQNRFGRDSIDGAGMALVSSVHSTLFPSAGAWWVSNHMVYVDGDGYNWGDLTQSLDVIAHEFTHGVTEEEADLFYYRESGAINEAFSDIFGAAAEAWAAGAVTADTWKIAEASITPNTAGDALRYLNDPTLDGISKDYYPERDYPGSCTPTNQNDACGVHTNSGIANLAFYLLVQGGRHPRGVTSTTVGGIGLAKAEQIFYRAHTYLTQSSGFASLRDAVVRSAVDLYGSSVVPQAKNAFCAVGVGLCAPPLSVQVTGPTSRSPNQSGTWTCSASGGTPPYTYDWFKTHAPPRAFTDLGSSPTQTTSHATSFNIVCDVRDSVGGYASNYVFVNVNGGGNLPH